MRRGVHRGVGQVGFWKGDSPGQSPQPLRVGREPFTPKHMQFAAEQKRERGISVWSTPLTRGRMKIFLLKIDGHHKEEDEDYLLLVSLMVTLCSSLILVSSP